MRLRSKPLMQTFELKSDPDQTAAITVRQATEGETIERNEMFSKQKRSYENGETGEVVKFEQNYNVRKIRRKEAYLVLASITGIVDENDREVFKTAEGPSGPRIKTAMTEDEFNSVFNKLPTAMAIEIYEKVLEVNPDWGGASADEEDEEGE